MNKYVQIYAQAFQKSAESMPSSASLIGFGGLAGALGGGAAGGIVGALHPGIDQEGHKKPRVLSALKGALSGAMSGLGTGVVAGAITPIMMSGGQSFEKAIGSSNPVTK
jgi:hypothetical protein